MHRQSIIERVRESERKRETEIQRERERERESSKYAGRIQTDAQTKTPIGAGGRSNVVQSGKRIRGGVTQRRSGYCPFGPKLCNYLCKLFILRRPLAALGQGEEKTNFGEAKYWGWGGERQNLFIERIM